jgi:hypothetical protein
VKILAVKCTQAAEVFEKYGREHLPPPGNTASCHIPVEGLNCKRPIPTCRLFFKIDLLTDIAALCFTDFIDWRLGYSDFHNLMGFTSKKMPNNIL